MFDPQQPQSWLRREPNQKVEYVDLLGWPGEERGYE